ncbi:MAG: hypothetical protein KVP17_003306 [Porospora cf. gigantea B]|nr:MAG: hypothetical protein KVP17_003306 [Porospora cf. gigantea B]
MWRPDLSWLHVGSSYQERPAERSESPPRHGTTPAGPSVTLDNMLTVDVEGQLLNVGTVKLEALDFVLGGKPLVVEAPTLRYWRQKRARPKERKPEITIDLSTVDPTRVVVPSFVSFSLAQIDVPVLRPSLNDYLRRLAESDDPAAWITVTLARTAGMDQAQRLDQWQEVGSRFPDCAAVARALLDCKMDDRTANCRDLLNALKSQALRTHSAVLTELIATYLRSCVLLGDLSGFLQMASCLVQSLVLREPPALLVDPCAFGLPTVDGTIKKQLEPLSPPRALPTTRHNVQTTEAALEIWALLQGPNSLAEEVVFHVENSDSRPLLGVPLGLSWGLFASLPLEEVLQTIGIGRLVSHHPAIIRRQWYLGSASSFWDAPESSPLRMWLESDLSMHSVSPSGPDLSFASMVLGCMWPVFSTRPTLFLGHHLLCALFSFPKTSRPLVQAVLQRLSESPTILLTFAACLLKAGDKALLEARKVLLSLMQRLGCARHVALAWAYLEAIRVSPDLGLVSAVLEAADSRELTDLSWHVPSSQVGAVAAVHTFTACPAFPPDGAFAHKASAIMRELCDRGIMAAMNLLLLA